ILMWFCFFFSSRRRHTRFSRDWSSDVCSSDLIPGFGFELLLRFSHVRQVLANAAISLTALLFHCLNLFFGFFQRLADGFDQGFRSEERRVGKECMSWGSRVP